MQFKSERSFQMLLTEATAISTITLPIMTARIRAEHSYRAYTRNARRTVKCWAFNLAKLCLALTAYDRLGYDEEELLKQANFIAASPSSNIIEVPVEWKNIYLYNDPLVSDA